LLPVQYFIFLCMSKEHSFPLEMDMLLKGMARSVSLELKLLK